MKTFAVMIVTAIVMVLVVSSSYAHESGYHDSRQYDGHRRHHQDFGREIRDAAIEGAVEGLVRSIISPVQYYAPPPVVYRQQYSTCVDDVWVPAVVRWNPRYRVYEEMRPGYYKKVRVPCY